MATTCLTSIGVQPVGEVALVGRLREAIQRLNPAIPEVASAFAVAHAHRRAAIKHCLIARFLRELNP